VSEPAWEIALAAKAAKAALSAFECLSKGALREAAKIWVNAIPCREASLLDSGNGAIGMMMLGHEPEDVARLLDSAEAQAASLADAAALSLAPLRATSTGHHFRLAAKHADAFARAGAKRDSLLCSTMLTQIGFHRDLASSSSCHPQRGEHLRDQLMESFGRSAPEIALLDAEDQATISQCYALKAERLGTLLDASTFNGQPDHEFLAAALGLLTPAMLAAARAQRD
jgi:hypothetical protein